MPLSRLQSQILRVLAAHRNPESYVAGSTPLHRGAFRFSDDIDIFHDREERVARAAVRCSRLEARDDYLWPVMLPADGFAVS